MIITKEEIKKFFDKQILPNLKSNNYGYSDEIIVELGKLGNPEILKKSTAEQTKPLKKLKVGPPAANSLITDAFVDEINVLPFYEKDNQVSLQTSGNGNVKVRDEIGGSSLMLTIRAERRLNSDDVGEFPIYDPFTDTIDYGTASTAVEIELAGTLIEKQ